MLQLSLPTRHTPIDTPIVAHTLKIRYPKPADRHHSRLEGIDVKSSVPVYCPDGPDVCVVPRCVALLDEAPISPFVRCRGITRDTMRSNAPDARRPRASAALVAC